MADFTVYGYQCCPVPTPVPGGCHLIVHNGELMRSRCARFVFTLKSASNLNGNLNCSKELEHYAS